MRRALTFTWAAGIDLLLDAVLGTLWFAALFALLITGVATLPALGFGLIFLGLAASLTRFTGWVERVRADALLSTRITVPVRPVSTQTGWKRPFAQAIEDLRDANTWRVLLHHFASMLLGTLAVTIVWAGLITAVDLVLGSRTSFTAPLLDTVGRLPSTVIAIVALALIGVLVYFAGVFDRTVLAPLLGSPKSAALRQEIDTLAGERQAAVDAATIERTRIERDLHDGAQPRLVAVAMTLGMARSKLDTDPATARMLLEQAHADAKLAITDLRQLARGIHPAVLTDRGLDAALSALASRCSVPTRVDVQLRERQSAEIEAVVYFTIAEALTNVSKHSLAKNCQVSVSCTDGILSTTVTDDGRGSAAVGDDLVRGGLAGIDARVRAAGGTLTIDSPAGGPTRLTMELPCAS
ncbi:sensor histidine kinase [Glaciibacter superstes]|uniref:sensor histidine kinase n=1 Tax=Glaciibacter superstes TaxID=501023 RepID=UPI0003B79E67|nr:histidine kinase [Glaciibacter superstes]